MDQDKWWFSVLINALTFLKFFRISQKEFIRNIFIFIDFKNNQNIFNS